MTNSAEMSESAVDLHSGFTTPGKSPTSALTDFLTVVDQLPSIKRIQQAMRAEMPLSTVDTLVDVGCGAGIETARIARDFPNLTVVGCDQNPEMIAAASAQPISDLNNITWRHAAWSELDHGCADIIRTERVLMYADDLREAVATLLRALRPGGTLVSFELDYGGMILREGTKDQAVLDRISDIMRASLPQPLAGRRVGEFAGEEGAARVRTESFAFNVTPAVWHRIVGATIRHALEDDSDPEVLQWLDEHDDLTEHEFHGSFSGILTAATVPA